MRRVFRLIVAAFFVGGWLLAASAVHVIVLPADDGGRVPSVGLLPKNRLGFADTYVDARAWTPADAAGHPDLVKRVVEAGRVEWLAGLVGGSGDGADAKLRELLRPAGADAEKPPEKPKPALKGPRP